MSPATAVRTCLRKWADFDGRATAAEYWWFLLFFVLVYTAGSGLDWLAGTTWDGVGLFWLLTLVGLVVPLLAVGSRRLHDTGRTGLWQLVCMVPCGGILLLFHLADPSQGDNQYGPRLPRPTAPHGLSEPHDPTRS